MLTLMLIASSGESRRREGGSGLSGEKGDRDVAFEQRITERIVGAMLLICRGQIS